jgi:hypothetical protein
MDSETSSPVESQNSVVKEKLGVNGKMDISPKTKRRAIRSLNQANMSSRSPT